MRGRILASALLLFGVAFAVGCERSGKDAPSVADYERKRAELAERKQGGAKVAKKRVAPAAAAEGGSGLVSGGEFAYEPKDRRDPFRSFVLEQAQHLAKHERGPLEQFDLSQLTVVAVVWGTERPRALVTDPSGRGYVVQEGTPIGKNAGQVIRIGDTTVMVRETYVDYLGEATSKEIVMRIRSKAQGG